MLIEPPESLGPGIKTGMGHKESLDPTALDRAGLGWLWTSKILMRLAAEKALVPLNPLSQPHFSFFAHSLLPVIFSPCPLTAPPCFLLTPVYCRNSFPPCPAKSVFRSYRQLPLKPSSIVPIPHFPASVAAGRASLSSVPVPPAGSPASQLRTILICPPPGHTLPHPPPRVGGQALSTSNPPPHSPEAPSQGQPLTTSTQRPPLIGLIYSAKQHFVTTDNAAFPAPMPFTTAWHKAPGS